MDTSKLRAILESSLEAFETDDDDGGEDIDESLAEQFASGIRLVETSRPGPLYRSALFMVGPMYASESLSSYAGFMSSLEPAGLRIHHALVVDVRGRVISGFRKGDRDIAVPLNSKGDLIAQKWLNESRIKSGLAISGVKSLSDPLYGEAALISRGLLSSVEPIVHFCSKTVSVKIKKQRIASVEMSLRDCVQQITEQALSVVSDKLASIVDTDSLSLASRSTNPSIATYNYLVASPRSGVNPEWAKRNREQSLTALTNLTGLLTDYNESADLSEDLRESIDCGSKTADFLAHRFNARPPAIKAFLSSTLGEMGRGTNIDERWISEYLRIAETVPAMRIPTKEQDIRIAKEMFNGHEQLAILSRSTHAGDHRALWEGVLKNGWAQACDLMMKIYHHNIPQDEAARWRLAGVVLEQVASVTRDIQDIVELGKRIGKLSNSLDAQFIKTAYLKDKTIKAIGELRGVLITMKNQAEMKHIEILGLGPSDQEWSPLLPNRQIEINGVRFTELVSRKQLQQQTDEIINCVHGYGPQCLNNGSRIFSVRSDGPIQGHFSTLETRISSDCLSVSIRQHTSYRNGAVCNQNTEAAKLLVERINNGTLEANMNGFRSDRLSNRSFGSSNIEEVKRRADTEMYAILSEGLSCLLPRSSRGMNIETYLASEQLKQERPSIEKSLAKLAAFDDEQKSTAAQVSQQVCTGA